MHFDHLDDVPVPLVEVIEYLGHLLDALVPGLLVPGRVDSSLDQGVEVVVVFSRLSHFHGYSA